MIRLGEGRYCRHPLVYLVEAADDICYQEQRQHLFHWLNQINEHDMPKNNWRFFRVLVNIGFLNVGLPADEARLASDLEELESHYCADGWYFDKPAQRDYYTLWAFHWATRGRSR